MPKMSAEERAELEAKLAADDDDEPDHDFEYSEGDRTVRLPWSKRHSLAEEFGFKGGPRKVAKAEAKDGGEKEDGTVKRPPFGRRIG